ncbi:hypothetical protein LCGC14_1380080 [marine sediment metagenome]|uniref:HNH nuclease domain-containing protein n=1 Tax=marine sediment metagenome TaxID=412755 RepID=A0A0F9N4M2_9ZZZZ
MTKKRDEFQLASNELFLRLWEHRAHGTCELKGKGCKGWWMPSPHHIIKRSQGYEKCKNEAWNILVLCPVCHYRADHPNSSINGLPKFTQAEQFELAEKLNRRYGIE